MSVLLPSIGYGVGCPVDHLRLDRLTFTQLILVEVLA